MRIRISGQPLGRILSPIVSMIARHAQPRTRSREWLSVVLLFTSVGYPGNDQPAQEFVDAKAEKYRQEYVDCTGDFGKVSLADVLRWRQNLGRFAESSEYPAVLKHFVSETGADPQSVQPCQVMVWHEWNKVAKKKTAPEPVAAQPAKPAPAPIFTGSRPISLDSLDFGCSQRDLRALIARNNPVGTEGDSLRIGLKSLIVGDVAYPASLILARDKFCAVSISTPYYAADSLDLIVRGNADDLVQTFSARFGPADRRYRVGLMDIKESALAPVARWDRGELRVWVGLSRRLGRYCAMALLVHREMLAEGVSLGVRVDDPGK